MYKVVEIEGIGTVLFKKDRKYRRLSMRIDVEGRLIVNLPFCVPSSYAIEWVVEKKIWVLKHMNRVEEKKSKSTLFMPGTIYKTHSHRIEFIRSDKPGLNLKKYNNIFVVSFSNDIPEQTIIKPEIQGKLRKVVESVYTKEAKSYLIPKTKKIAQSMGFKHGRISVRNNKSRWGSCSYDDNISLNIHLMRLPEHIIDYVILHELCHTIEKNHSKNFWDLMEKVCPCSKEIRKELRQYSTVLY